MSVCIEVIDAPIRLFKDSLSANEISVAGNRLGDSIKKIPLDEIYMAEPDKYPSSSLYSEKDGSIVGKVIHYDISLQEKKELVITQGGWLGYHKEHFTFRIRNQKVDAFYLTQDALSTLDIYSKDELVSMLGNNITISKEYDFDEDIPVTEIFHLNRQISITWDELNNEIFAIGLGNVVNEK